jgi:fibronectin type 3 domain-containing protein
MSGCSTQTGPTHFTNKVDKNIPAIPSLRWIGDITAIALEWDPNYDPSIAGYHIYRKLKDNESDKFKRVASIHDRFTSHFIDLHLPFETKYLYKISAFNHAGSESVASKAASTITRPTLKSVAYFDSVSRLPRKAKLIWRPHTNGRVSDYILERKTPAQKEWHELTRLEHRLSAEFIDKKLEDNQVYYYRLRAVTFDKIISTPSDIVKIVTKALPKPVTGVTISTELPTTIKMTWDKHPQKDIKEYIIYRSDSSDGDFKKLDTVKTPGFINKINGFGKNFYYKVSAIDHDGLESPHSKIFHGQNLTRPAKVSLHVKEIKDGTATLKWEKVDERTVGYKVTKIESLGWFNSKKTDTNTTQTTYTTTQQPNVPVKYKIFAVDKHGIESKPVETEDLIYEKVVQ